MKRYTTTQLRRLEIVNICDGSRLGYACDFEFEAEGDCSRITALIIGGNSGFCGFFCTDDIIIPWRCVQCIGEDAILVKLTPQELTSCCFPSRHRRKT